MQSDRFWHSNCINFGYFTPLMLIAMCNRNSMILPVLLMLSVMMALLSCRSENHSVVPPQIVRSAFETHFGKEAATRWEVSNEGFYSALYSRDGHAFLSCFDRQGNLLKTEKELISSELPPVVIKTVVGAFPGNTVTKALQVDSANRETIYRLMLKRKRIRSTVDLSQSGVILTN